MYKTLVTKTYCMAFCPYIAWDKVLPRDSIFGYSNVSLPFPSCTIVQLLRHSWISSSKLWKNCCINLLQVGLGVELSYSVQVISSFASGIVHTRSALCTPPSGHTSTSFRAYASASVSTTWLACANCFKIRKSGNY